MSELIFKRYEKKYLLDHACYKRLTARLNPLLCPDIYPEFEVANLYMDTPDFLLAEKSAGSAYREKLRLRVYTPDTDTLIPADTRAFIELKKKIQGVSYKRRVQMTLEEAERFLREGTFPEDPASSDASLSSYAGPDPAQVLREISYTISHYNLLPRAITAYHRKAFILGDFPLVRVTFDSDLRYRITDLSLTHGSYGTPLIDSAKVIMEIKMPFSLPYTLSRILSEEGVFSSPFSKYGAAYAAERR